MTGIVFLVGKIRHSMPRVDPDTSDGGVGSGPSILVHHVLVMLYCMALHYLNQAAFQEGASSVPTQLFIVLRAQNRQSSRVIPKLGSSSAPDYCMRVRSSNFHQCDVTPTAISRLPCCTVSGCLLAMIARLSNAEPHGTAHPQ